MLLLGQGKIDLSRFLRELEKELQLISVDSMLVTGYSTEMQAYVSSYLSADRSFEPDEIFTRFRRQIVQLKPLNEPTTS